MHICSEVGIYCKFMSLHSVTAQRNVLVFNLALVHMTGILQLSVFYVLQIPYIYCKTVLIIRSKIRYLILNWSIINENGLHASCLLSNYSREGIDFSFCLID